MSGRPPSRRTALQLAAAGLVPGLMSALGSTRTAAQAAPAVELLMFEEPGCPWCRRWRAEVGVGYPHSPEGKLAPLRVVQLATRLPEGVSLARPVHVSPTFVLVQNGREVGRITGYPGAEFFWPMLAGLLGRLGPEPQATRPAPQGQGPP